MKVTFWGTRGSQATPGEETVRYGGNTSCVEVRATPDTTVVLDAGTGLRRLGLELDPAVARIDLLLSHLHLDHIQGLGFFPPLYREELEVHIWGPGSATTDLHHRLSRYMSPPLFPVRLSELTSDLHVHDINETALDVPGMDVSAALVCHPGPTVGYRLESASGSLAYLPDHEPALASRQFARDPEWCSGIEVAAGVDLLIHDSQYTDDEYETRVGWGHSTLGHTLAFANIARAKTLVPFHFDPAHDDDALDEFFAEAVDDARMPFRVVPAREDHTIVVGE
jgi:phosphoribosyl 1,2-cyclic phosphodiesterase